MPISPRALAAPFPATLALLLAASGATAQSSVSQNAQSGPAARAAESAEAYYSATEPNVPEKAGKVLHALRLTGDAPVIDGALDEAVWAQAPAATDFVQ